MKSKALRWILGGAGAFFLLSALIITLVEYNRFDGGPRHFPAGSRVAGVPVGGLDAPEAEARLAAFYSQPLTLAVDGSRVQVDPAELGFTLDPGALVAEAAAQIPQFGWWDFLWGRTNPSTPVDVPLQAEVDQARVRVYLESEIVPRYTQPGLAAVPIPGTTNFTPGQPGQRLRLDQAVAAIEAALLDPAVHQVSLQVESGAPAPPSLEMLEAFLRHNLEWSGFNDLAEVYLQSMATGETLHFAVRGGAEVTPDVAFTAASTSKIPIMVSVLRRADEPTPEAVVALLARMIAFSENPPADTLMSTYIDEVRGPLLVTEDMAALGLENTFLAGYFYLGAPLLQRFETPANGRTDVFLDPDIYNQTVPSEVGRLLAAIYTCAEDGSGLLTETFPGEITRSECQLMVDTLAANRIGLLIEAGLPPAATTAHKHGWVQELDGQIRSMSDVALVFTPGGDYVLNVFIYDAVRLDFDQGNRLVARLSQTVYNFFNLEDQAYWWFD
ncbi:MAG: class A beta-lactamase-related serine hydrolase [Brevefilum sp.]|nr:class A beta-lactamase-related serine hydrolase [Brevefilum sp.]